MWKKEIQFSPIKLKRKEFSKNQIQYNYKINLQPKIQIYKFNKINKKINQIYQIKKLNKKNLFM